MKLRIFTDGACSGNPGPGGWAAVFALKEENEILSGGVEETTNNRMELLAVVNALRYYINKYSQHYKEVEIHSDSAYVVNALTKGWLAKWRMNNWKTVTNDDVKNCDLWEELDDLIVACRLIRNCSLTLVKVKGHDGVLLNEMVDERARKEVQKIKKERT